MSKCMICGNSATPDDPIIKCQVPNCKKYFHNSCSNVGIISGVEVRYCKNHYEIHLENIYQEKLKEDALNKHAQKPTTSKKVIEEDKKLNKSKNRDNSDDSDNESNKTEVTPPRNFKESLNVHSTPQREKIEDEPVDVEKKNASKGTFESIKEGVSSFFNLHRNVNYNLRKKADNVHKNQNKEPPNNKNNQKMNREFNFNRNHPHRRTEFKYRNDKESDSDETSINCVECSREIKRDSFSCRVCFSNVHRVCIPQVQSWSISNSKKTYTCIECQKYLNEAERRKSKTNRNYCRQDNNSSPYQRRSKQQGHVYNIEGEDDSRYDNSNNNVSNKYQFAFNEKVLPMSEQLFFTERKLYHKLPVVVDLERSWRLFYTAYQQSKNFFDDSGNVLRISKAIKCKEVLEIGGDNLFETDYYDETIELINKRGRGTEDLAIKLRARLSEVEKPENEDDESTLKFLDLIKNFFNLIKREQMYNYLHDPSLCVEIILKLPRRTSNFLSTKRREAKERGEPYYISAIMPYIDTLSADTKHKMEMIRMIEKSKVNKKKIDRINITYESDNSDSDSSECSKTERTQALSPVGNRYACWYHPKSDSHTANKCKTLWGMSGEEAAKAAIRAGRCIICGLPQHFNSICPHSKGLNCNLKTCQEHHHAMFCKKRPRKERKDVLVTIDADEATYIDECNSLNVFGDDEEEKVTLNTNAKINDFNEDLLYFRVKHIVGKIDGRNSSVIKEAKSIIRNVDQCNKKVFSKAISLNKNKISNVIVNTARYESKKLVSSSHQLPVVVCNIITPKEKRKAVFLLDSGSTTSLIEKSFADEIFAKGIKYNLSIKGINSRKDDEKSRIIKLPISRLDDENRITYVSFHTFENLNISKQIFKANEYTKRFKHLKSLYLHDYEHIDGLIGIDNLKIFNWTVIENRTKVEYCPLGIRTIIGDTLIGCETPLERFFNDNVDQCEDKELFVNTCRNDSFDFRVHTLSRCNVVDHQHYQEEINLENYEEEYNKWEELIFLQENNQFESPNDSCNYYEERANSLLKKYVKRIPNSNHFQAPILWKEEDITLPTLQSYKIALRRFLITERNGKKKNEFYTYEEEMKKLLEKGYASKLTKTEINNISPLTYYVPIFFIKPENKRLRFIWDFKSKCEGKSYNDYVLSGPNLYSKIENILIHARTNEYLIKGDIEAMFHQVHLLDKDKDSMRFLFRFDNETEISVYRMNVLPFGAACSPILSLYVKNIIAEEIKLISPLAYDTLINSTYVDDTVRSLPNISTAVNLCIDLKRYLKTGGFNLLKLNSNSNEILEQLQRSFKNVSHEKLFINDKEEKILGYMFDLETDTITVCFDLNNLPRNTLKNIQKPTKRTVLQVTNGFYDPLGLFGFVTSKMKILYKRVCNTTKNWDDEISNELIPLWNKCIESYNKAKFVKIPRVCTLIDYDRIDLLGFCDAGKEMICIMVFIKSYKDEKSLTRLIESRTITVNNRRNYSIPELELEAAAQLSKMIIKLKDILNYKFDNIFLLTDSSIVIYQINREKKNKLSIYAENRIKTIRQNTNINNWYWISSDLQAADYGTKIESNCSLTYFNEWFIPKLCKENIDDWLKCNNNKTILNINELKENKNIDNDISIDSYKSFTALLNFSKRVFIFKYKFDSQYKAKKKEIEEIKEDKTLSSRQKRYILKEKERILNEIETFVEDDENWHNVAETHWLRRAQEEDKDIKDIRDILKSGKTIKKSNAFYKLLPYLDIDGLVRLRTRVNVNRQVLHLVDYDHIRPIILPKKHAITELIILEIHKNHAHSYFKTVVNSIKNKFYIRHMKNVVKRIIKTKCHYCVRFTTRLLKPIMGDLPQERLGAFEPPFSYIVIDVFGPIMVTPSKYSKKVIKRWVLACICLCTRASHMEILKDLSTESILEALEITFTIRGTAKEIYSDLAPSFLAANKKMISITNEWNIKLMSQGIIRSHIRWNNKAAYSPWTQGAAERMIGETKKLFKNFTRLMNIDSSGLTDFVLRHVLMKIVNVINNSPISIIEENCILNCLTPAHFIMMRENTQSHPLTDFNVDDLTQCWHGTKNIIKSFWEEWLRSYFNKILHREKWCTYSEPVKVGDFVLTAEKGYTDSWRIGRIIEIDMGSLEQVRAVKIKLGKNKIIENFSKLKNKKDIIDAYRKEQFSIVSRPSMLIAKINIQERNFKFKKENLRAGGVDAIMRKNDAKK